MNSLSGSRLTRGLTGNVLAVQVMSASRVHRSRRCPVPMDFPVALLSVLRGTDESGNGIAVDADLAGFAATSLNDDAEASFGVAPNPSQFDPDIVSKLQEVAALLHSIILASIMSEDTRRDALTDEEAEIYAQDTIQRIRESQVLQVDGDSEMKNLAELLRACKNLLRWYLQIFLNVTGPVLPLPLRRLQSHGMIELYLLIIQRTAGQPRSDARQQAAKHACLSLFYSTYNPSGNEQQIQRAQEHLVEIGFVEIALCLLLQNNSIEVLLSLVRLVHNLVTSLPGMAELVEETRAKYTESDAPWAPPARDEIDLRSLLVSVLMWASKATPAFPGEANDRRTDLVVEILRIFYVLRAGRYVESESSTAELIAYFIKLPNSEERAYRCKLAAITLLMDAPGEYSEKMVEQKHVLPLLAVLDIQVTRVVELSQSSSAATAAVVPILSVVNKFCIHSKAFRNKTKLFIFPAEAEERFMHLVAEAESRHTKNMHPLDAPIGTLRWKLINLMKSTESHIKRTSGELLWTICDQKEQDFIRRVGLGNALPILSAKGLVQLSC